MMRRRRAASIALVTLVLVALLPVALPPGSDGALDVIAHRPIGGISDGTSATQQFPAHGSAIHTITVYLATFGRVNQGTLHISVFAETNAGWQRLATRDLNEAPLEDNSYTTLVFSPPLAVTQGKGVRLVLDATASADNAVTWWTDPQWTQPGYQLMYNMTPVPGAAVFAVHYVREAHPLILALGESWSRITTFLIAPWQGLLLIALIGVVGSAFLIFRRIPEDDAEDTTRHPARAAQSRLTAPRR